MFETYWSKASNRSIHILNDPPSIRSVALVKDTDDFRKIKDAKIYDSSSRARTVSLHQIAIYQNTNGFYAAIKVLSIKDDSRGDGNEELSFEYFIQTNGSPDFTV